MFREPGRRYVGPVILSIDGKNYRDDSVCECGHWASSHRGLGNANTCEGFRCGCYTFRPLTGPSADARSPRCPVCNVAVTGKMVFLDEQDTMLTTTWLHEGQEGKTSHTASMPIPTIVGHMPVCSPGDCGCGLGNNWRPGDPVPEGAGVVLSEPKIRLGSSVSTKKYAPKLDPIDRPKEPPKPRFPTVNEHARYMAETRAERNKPQRAPREDEEIV
jgi:hypothetical protein